MSSQPLIVVYSQRDRNVWRIEGIEDIEFTSCTEAMAYCSGQKGWGHSASWEPYETETTRFYITHADGRRPV